MTDPTTLTADGSGAMFDRIADRYDLLNRIISLGIDNGWRRKTTEALKLDGLAAPRVLDLATGTADLAIATALRYPNATILGTDPSRGMIKIGDDKLVQKGIASRVTLTVGDAQAIEAEDASFDAVTISFGIRNVPDRDRALREMKRVLKPGGIAAILELGEPRSGILGPLARFHIRQVVPRLGAWLSGAKEYRYLQQSIAAFPEPEAFTERMQNAGLESSFTPLTFGVVHLYVGKRGA